jgi:hypothetical protein
MSEIKMCTLCGRAGHRASTCPWGAKGIVSAALPVRTGLSSAAALALGIVRPARLREKNVEQYLDKAVRAAGGETRKVAFPGRVGAPDRFVMFPGGVAVWVEVKAPGEKPRASQVAEHLDLQRLGQRVAVVDSLGGVDALVKAHRG